MLVGRDREVSAIEVALELLASGAGTLFLFAGEPGIGKTRLATEVMHRARGLGVRTSWGRCWEAGGSPALWPWREALEGLGIAFPEPAAVAADPKEARFALFRDVAAVLGQAAARERCVLVLDDLHAADHSSLMLLEWVAARIDTLPIVIVGTYRDLEARLSADTSASLGRASRTARVFQLAPLVAEDVSSLVRDAIANADERLIASIFETTRGNPLFVDELVRDARSSSSGTARIPLGVREIIRQRLSLIGDDARRVLEAGAVLGVEFAAANAARMDTAAPAVLDDAERSGLVIARGDRFRFAHSLYREALYHDLPRDRRRELHRDAARALAAGDAPVSEIAHHLLEAGPDAVAGAVDHAIRAAYQALAVFAFEDASALLERARLAELDRELRCRVLIAIGEVRIRSGDPSGRASCTDAAALARELDAPELLARAGLAYGSVLMMGGVDPVLVRMLEEALERLPASAASLRALVMARLATARQPTGPADRPRDIQLGFDAIDVARSLGEPHTLLEVIHAASGVMYGAVEPPIRLANSREQERLAEQLGDVTRLLHAKVRISLDHLEMGNFAAHAELAGEYEQLAARHGPAAAPWRVPLMRSMQALVVDDFARSEQLQAEARRLEHDQPRARRATAFHRICFLRAAERHAELRAAIPELRGLWLQMPYGAHLADARVASVLARIGAVDELRALLAQLPASAFEEQINGAALAEAVWATGDPTHARVLLGHLHLERWPMYWFDCEIVEGPATRQAAYVAALAGEWAQCEQLFARALRDVEGAGRRSLAARMRFELGDLMLRLEHEPDRARTLIAQGRAAAASLELDELVALIDRRHPAGTDGERLSQSAAPARPASAPVIAIAREGEYVALTSARGTVRFKATRGMEYLARLIERPGVEVHVLELVGSADHADRGDAGELLDADATRAYRARLDALRDALADAEELGDVERAERARSEMEDIAAELSRASGRGGRARRAESAVDRARSAVQRRIKDALDRIAAQDAELGRWLRHAVRTGNYCSYRGEL